jgi:hypothetical protein
MWADAQFHLSIFSSCIAHFKSKTFGPSNLVGTDFEGVGYATGEHSVFNDLWISPSVISSMSFLELKILELFF